MKNILSIFLAVLAIFVTYISCENTHDISNPVLGSWKSLYDKKSNFVSADFNVTFETDKTFHVEVYGLGQTLPIKITGSYYIHKDTLMVLDKVEEPVKLCSYSDTGKYTFIQREDTLNFKVIKDLCERRKITFELGLYRFR